MLIYLDNCCYNRPFDIQTQPRVYLETQAKLFIQALITGGKLDLAWSYVLSWENSKNPHENRKLSIEVFSAFAKTDIDESYNILNNATEIMNFGLKSADSLHLACAIEANADYFITTDDRVLKLNLPKIKITDPIQFIKIWEKESKK